MPETTNSGYNILYIGREQSVADLFSNSGYFNITVKANPLAAIYWLTDNQFKIFDLDKDTRFEVTYEEKQNIDAIICEMLLPGINAFAFYRRLKLNKLYQKTPFIVVSFIKDYRAKKNAYLLGIDDFYHRGINPENIYNRIKLLKKFKSEFENKTIAVETNLSFNAYKPPVLKRTFDLLVACTALLILSPLMILTMLAIRIESKGKVYYFSKRVGSNYKIFDFYKFRSMYPDADKRLSEVEHLNQYISETVEEDCVKCAELPEGQFCSPLVYYDGKQVCERIANKRKRARKAFLKIKDDPRITAVGKFIRRTSIDELPQLINVIKGDMSIVGNRPLPLNEAEALTKKKWSRRFRAAAGLTGLWQVEKRGRTGSMSEEERFALDNYYAEHNSFWGDLVIIFRTFGALFQKENV
jgi:lipopolysaccharide/colanic/teichoic acid biosynthesis glycosyltransferase